MTNDFHINLTEKAIETFNLKLKERNTPDARIRLGIRGGGCKGFKYIIQFEDAAPRDKDLEFSFNNLRVLVDKKSIIYLNGCIVDYEQTLLASGFKFINPGAKSYCGCGTSFTT